jgi:hypothetical protein
MVFGEPSPVGIDETLGGLTGRQKQHSGRRTRERRVDRVAPLSVSPSDLSGRAKSWRSTPPRQRDLLLARPDVTDPS